MAPGRRAAESDLCRSSLNLCILAARPTLAARCFSRRCSFRRRHSSRLSLDAAATRGASALPADADRRFLRTSNDPTMTALRANLPPPAFSTFHHGNQRARNRFSPISGVRLSLGPVRIIPRAALVNPKGHQEQGMHRMAMFRGNRITRPSLPPRGPNGVTQMKRVCSTMAILLMTGGLALAQAGGGGAGGGGAGGAGGSTGAGAAGTSGAGAAGGGTGPSTGSGSGMLNPNASPNGGTTGLAPGVNSSNPQDQTNRNNPNDLTKPGGNNPQDMKR